MSAQNDRPRRVLATAIAALFAGVAGSNALAQQQQEEPGDALLEQITVTGSRIAREIGFTTPVPVTSVTTEELVEFEPGGTLTEGLAALPQFFATNVARNVNGALGTFNGNSGINMRNLGAGRTLVLLDGARVVPSDRTSAVNTDLFPTALMQRVDVVTGGATAAYGADALAGATNFVLNRQFQGLRGEMRLGRNERGDGDNYNLSLAGGLPVGGRTHVIFSLERQEMSEFTRNRANGNSPGDWFQNYAYFHNPAWSPDAPPGIPQRIVMPNSVRAVNSPLGMISAQGSALNRMVFTEDGNDIRAFEMGDVGCISGCTINGTTGGRVESSQDIALNIQAFDTGLSSGGVERTSGFFGFQFDWSPQTQVFGHLLVGDIETTISGRRGNTSIAMPVLEGANTQATIYLENPFLPESVRQIMLDEGRSSIAVRKYGTVRGEGLVNIVDNVMEKDEYQMRSIMGGLDQALPYNWHLRLHAQTGETRRDGYAERLLLDRLYLGIDAVEHPDTGEIVCNIQVHNPTEQQLRDSVADHPGIPWSQGAWWLKTEDSHLVPIPGPINLDRETIDGCVPINIFGIGNVDPRVRDWLLATPKRRHSTVKQHFVEAVFSGSLHEGIGAGSFDMAVGLNWRQESLLQMGGPRELEAYGGPQNVPELGIRGIPQGYVTAPNLHQSSTVGYINGQVRVREAFAEMELPLLSTTRGQSINTNLAWRYSQYAPGGSSHSHKIGGGFILTNDLRLRATYSRDMREAGFNERFEAGGAGGGTITDPRYNEDVLIITTTQGNPNLDTEKADTFTAGVVYQPSFLPGVQAAIDYYEINQFDRIGGVPGGASGIAEECELNNVFCEFVTRSDATDRITRVIIGQVNLAHARVRGIDVDLLWRTNVDFIPNLSESISLRALVGYMYENSRLSQIGATRTETVGGVGTPRATGTASFTYNVGNYRFGLSQRMRSSVIRGGNPTNPWEDGVQVACCWARIGSYGTTDMNLGYNGEFQGTPWGVALSVTNLFDRDPPIFPSMPGAQFGGSGQSVNSNYDAMGRRYSVRFNFTY